MDSAVNDARSLLDRNKIGRIVSRCRYHKYTAQAATTAIKTNGMNSHIVKSENNESVCLLFFVGGLIWNAEALRSLREVPSDDS